MKCEINELPAPTFRWLKMNGVLIDEDVLPQQDQVVTVPAGRRKNLIYAADGTQEVSSRAYDLVLEKDAVLNLVIAAADAGESPVVLQVRADCGENALLHVFWVFTGGKAVYPSVRADLNGDGSRLELDAAYVVGADELLDLSIVSNHFGRNTVSRIEAKGVLRSRAKKVFRGTIDFKQGCKGASGTEREEVLLMDDEAVNQTVPLILCAEEDVAGNHGASVGRVDEEEQFYMESRGISPEEVERILLQAAVRAVIGKMPEEVRDAAVQAVGIGYVQEEEDRCG